MKLLTIKEAAGKMSVSTKTVYRLMGGGQLRKVKIGRSTRISEDDLNGYMEQQIKKGAMSW
ncbi:MAG: helix-turn-helix domain-containing protein [Desulfobacterales bacterium]|nr:helix-turn-helix domain-containing protein [Desulfobacterales bacterium]